MKPPSPKGVPGRFLKPILKMFPNTPLGDGGFCFMQSLLLSNAASALHSPD
jgi:hypothetical protein